jgi:hypothetical protein
LQSDNLMIHQFRSAFTILGLRIVFHITDRENISIRWFQAFSRPNSACGLPVVRKWSVNSQKTIVSKGKWGNAESISLKSSFSLSMMETLVPVYGKAWSTIKAMLDIPYLFGPSCVTSQ